MSWSVGAYGADEDKIMAKYDALDVLEPIINRMGFSVMTQDDPEYFGALLTFDQPKIKEPRKVTFPTSWGIDFYDPTPLTQEGQPVSHVWVGINGPNVYVGSATTGSDEPGYLGMLSGSGAMEDIVKWDPKYFGTKVPPAGRVTDPQVANKLLAAFPRVQKLQSKMKKR